MAGNHANQIVGASSFSEPASFHHVKPSIDYLKLSSSQKETAIVDGSVEGHPLLEDLLRELSDFPGCYGRVCASNGPLLMVLTIDDSRFEFRMIDLLHTRETANRSCFAIGIQNPLPAIARKLLKEPEELRLCAQVDRDCNNKVRVDHNTQIALGGLFSASQAGNHVHAYSHNPRTLLIEQFIPNTNDVSAIDAICCGEHLSFDFGRVDDQTKLTSITGMSLRTHVGPICGSGDIVEISERQEHDGSTRVSLTVNNPLPELSFAAPSQEQMLVVVLNIGRNGNIALINGNDLKESVLARNPWVVAPID